MKISGKTGYKIFARYKDCGVEGLTATFISRYDDQLIKGSRVLDLAGQVGSTPDWRGAIGLVWSSAPWSTAVFVHHTDSLRNEDIDPRIVRRNVVSQTNADLQLSYTPRGPTWMNGCTARLGAARAQRVCWRWCMWRLTRSIAS
jgi:hypothetical protein